MKQTQNIAPAAVSTAPHSTGPTGSVAMVQLKGRGRKQRIRQGSVRRCHMRPGCCVNVCVGGARGWGGEAGVDPEAGIVLLFSEDGYSSIGGFNSVPAGDPLHPGLCHFGTYPQQHKCH